MKIAWIKPLNDRRSFRVFEGLGAEVSKLTDLEETDNTIKKLIKENYTTIVITNEIAGFSGDIIKRYSKSERIKIIIAPPHV